ncbi:MAG: phosphoribosylanthranilate isomerase [Candidatus Omnitrophota bacterium]|nr:phosphoribosylanthranilate isomerase [Candidatus Omnitrophota bacterium]
MKIKICGITNLKDAQDAVRLGADLLGFVFYPQSRRYLLPENARKIIAQLPKQIKKAGVFVNESPARVRLIAEKCSLDILQFHGKESNYYCQQFPGYKIIKAFRIKNARSLKSIPRFKVDLVLLDTYSSKSFGGTGKSFNWDLLKELKRENIRIMLSGGLNPKNISTAIKKVKPDAVDISSGVEISPGRKSRRLMKKLFENITKTNF